MLGEKSRIPLRASVAYGFEQDSPAPIFDIVGVNFNLSEIWWFTILTIQMGVLVE